MNFRKYWKSYLVCFVISLLVGTGVFLLIFLLNEKTKISAQNGASTAAVILLCSGGLSFVASQGFFDFVSYGFKQMGSMLFSNNPRQYHDYPEYHQYKDAKRVKSPKYWAIILIAGLILLIIWFILAIALAI